MCLAMCYIHGDDYSNLQLQGNAAGRTDGFEHEDRLSGHTCNYTLSHTQTHTCTKTHKSTHTHTNAHIHTDTHMHTHAIKHKKYMKYTCIQTQNTQPLDRGPSPYILIPI